MAETSITGARTSSRIPIMRVICKLFTSLVSRVTREAVENFSILEKAKDWIWSYSALRRFAPKPWPARADKAALPRPKPRETSARPTIKKPFFRI